MSEPPENYDPVRELNWEAEWLVVDLRVELPFWLMLNNTTISVEVGGHTFPVSINGETFELHAGEVSDSKHSCPYQGPRRNRDVLSTEIQKILQDHPDSIASGASARQFSG